MRRKWAALLCALTVLMGLTLPHAAAAWDDGLTFIAVNIRFLPLAEFMPIRVNGSNYVPVSLFDSNSNGGTRLGIYNNGIGENNTFTLYNTASKFLTFDLSTGNSYDFYPDGTPQNSRAITRNGKIYVSVSSVCDYFGLEYTYRATTPYGYPLIRIKTANSPLYNDTEFVNAASSTTMLSVLNAYADVVNPSPAASLSPAPVTSGGGITVPGTTNRSDIVTRLAVRMETGAAGAAMLDTLRAEGRSALLLFPPDQLARQDDLVRRAVGEGHAIGLLVPGASVGEAGAAVREGNDLLAHIARIRTRMILADGADKTTRESLERQGYLCWTGNIDGVPGARTGYATAKAVMKQAGEKKTLAAITMDDTYTSATALTSILHDIRQEKYSYRAVVETEF